MKESAAALFDIPSWELDEWKNDPNAAVNIIKDMNSVRTQSVRSMLQRYGTESHRDIFGQNFWVDQVLPVGGYYAGRAICITDCRYRNEMERILTLQGHIVYIDRPGLDLQDPHSSETETEYGKQVGYTLDNSTTVSNLFDNVEKMLEELA